METALPTPFNRLLDLKGILEIHLTGTDLYRIAKRRRSSAEKIPACRSAIFAPSLLTYAIAKIYEELMEGSNIQIRVFDEVKKHSKMASSAGVSPRNGKRESQEGGGPEQIHRLNFHLRLAGGLTPSYWGGYLWRRAKWNSGRAGQIVCTIVFFIVGIQPKNG
jgi:hypothetical protein